MAYSITSLNIGKPMTYTINNKELHTAFVKHPTKSSVWLTNTGFEGDGQADLKNHGGKDKALLMYPVEHYSEWEQHYKQQFKLPSFGENITIDGLTEQDVCVGDVYALGEAVIQVSQPRQPCYKIAEINQLSDITAAVTETGYTGYYFRVLEEGHVSSSDRLELIRKDSNQISIAFIHQTLFQQRNNQERLTKILAVDSIASSLRWKLTKRLEKLQGKM